MPDSNLDTFLRASIRLHSVNKLLAVQSPFGRYSVFYAHSTRGHACPYVIMQLRYHRESWEKTWRPNFLAANIPNDIIEIGDTFAERETEVENTD